MGAAVSFYTLGCKVNHYETESIAALFKARGLTVDTRPQKDGESAGAGETVIVNTCTVTSKAEQKARRVIRAALKKARRVIVTGCYAELDGEALKRLQKEGGGELLVVRGGDKERFTLLAAALSAEAADQSAAAGPEEGEAFSPRSRPFIKIQDGCDNACAFCRTRLARGRGVSVESGAVLAALLAWEKEGRAEAVLTGVNICQYRSAAPSGGELDLAGLLRFLLDGTERIALRLSSLEPDSLSGALYDAIAARRVRPHFHLSVQSGDAAILKAMGRRYTPEAVTEAVRRLREAREDPFIACDIITGFPGETEAAFERTARLCERLDFAWIHAFPYSRRPGTAAFSMQGRVPEREAARRAAFLGELARRGKRAYISRWLNKRPLAAVLETPAKGGFCAALTENYIKVTIERAARAGEKSGGAALCLPRALDKDGTVRALILSLGDAV